MKRFILVLSIVSILTVVGCDKEVVISEPSSIIGGVVVDSLSQQSLDSVLCTLLDTLRSPSFTTDSLGHFSYGAFGNGVRKVFFQKQGYDTKFLDINFTDNPTDLKIELVKQ